MKLQLGIGVSHLLKRETVFEFLESVFAALWYPVDGTSMIDMMGGSPLTLSVDPGVDYIPATYAGTITAPDVQELKDADVNDVLYTALGASRQIPHSDFVATDLERVPVKYDNLAPHHIRMIGLLDPVVFPTLTPSDKMKISNYMDLWVFYWGGWLDAGSVNKENRTI